MVDEDVATLTGDHRVAVDQRAHCLDGVERHAFGPRHQGAARPGRQVVDESVDQECHRGVAERLQVDHGRAPTGRERRPLLEQLRPRQQQHEEPGPAGLEQVLDQVEQAAVGVLGVLEEEHDGLVTADPLEERRPRREEVGPVEDAPVAAAEQRRDPRGQPGGLGGRRRHGGDTGADLLLDLRRSVGVEHLEPRAHHLGERPEGDAVAVGQAAATVPEERVGEPVDVLLELPAQPALADARDAGDDGEPRPAVLLRRVEELADLAQLTLATGHRRLEAVDPLRPAHRRDDGVGAVEARPARPCP